MLRKAMFAGSFYDAHPHTLKEQIKDWFDDISLPETSDKLIGVICPHAGYVYSGSCAAHSYKLLSQGDFKTAVIIHPSHRVNHFGYSVSPFEEYETPLGNLKVDKVLAEKLKTGSDDIDEFYHQNEHSMEVQLPFLAYINPDIKIVPVMIGNQNYKVSHKLTEHLYEKINVDDTVIIVSTDLSHYLSAQVASAMDSRLIEYIQNNDAEHFFDSIIHHRIQACGFCGILTMMHLTKHLENSYIEKLKYAHSGEVSGDFDQVVGYLSAALIKKEKQVV